jgi:quercetin dioxygenase-like cupin family protein
MEPLIVAPGEGRDYDWANDHIFVKVPAKLTDGRVTVVEDVLKRGFHLEGHYHKVMTESFYILEGDVVFTFPDRSVTASPGAVVHVPPATPHDVSCRDGGRLITVFSPGGFDVYLSRLASLTPDELAHEALTTALAEEYDTWQA